MKRLVLAVMAVVLLTVSVGACNTVKGVGRDIEAGGEALQNATE